MYAITGEHKIALDMIERLMVELSHLNWWNLKYIGTHALNKIFKDNPRYKRIIREDEEKFRREATFDISKYLP